MSAEELTNFSTSKSTLKPATSNISTSLHDAVKLRLEAHGIVASKPQTIPEFFDECCLKYAEKPALKYQHDDTNNEWTVVTYADYAHEVENAALLLLHLGLERRSSLGILATNCPEWFYAEMGALGAGGIVAGIYPSNSAEAVYHALNTSEATVCIVDDSQQMAKVRAVRERLPRLRAVVQLHGPYAEFVGIDEGYYRWSDLISIQFDAELHEELALRKKNIYANECAMLIYTSGTVGMPKAVMLSHDSVLYASHALSTIFRDYAPGEEVIVSYLPLNHIAAQTFDVFIGLRSGACVYFADRMALKGTLGRTLAQARPTRFLGVPRVYEKMQEQLCKSDGKSSIFGKFLLEKARENNELYHLDKMHGKSNSNILYWLSSKLTNNIKATMGLDRCKTFLVGGAPLSIAVKRFFLSLNIILVDIYGMSETAGAIAINNEQQNLENVGKAVQGCEIKILNPSSDGCGEICMRCRSNFMGYLHDVVQTEATLKENGWLHSGDMGYLDSEGNLYITGRIKELIITAGAENIPPVRIEEMIKRELPIISNAMLVGDRRKYLTILLTIKTKYDENTGLPSNLLADEVVDWLKSLGLICTKLADLSTLASDADADDVVAVKLHPKIYVAIQEGIERANANAISHAQRVQKFTILPHDFSIATGELGPTLKMRRNVILQKYANVIDTMYEDISK